MIFLFLYYTFRILYMVPAKIFPVYPLLWGKMHLEKYLMGFTVSQIHVVPVIYGSGVNN